MMRLRKGKHKKSLKNIRPSIPQSGDTKGFGTVASSDMLLLEGGLQGLCHVGALPLDLNPKPYPLDPKP